MKRTVILLLLATQLAACSLLGDRRDAPWDPKAGSGRTLLDQIPNNEGGAAAKCCGHLRQCKPYQSPRC
jgi:hypothetical protein